MSYSMETRKYVGSTKGTDYNTTNIGKSYLLHKFTAVILRTAKAERIGLKALSFPTNNKDVRMAD